MQTAAASSPCLLSRPMPVRRRHLRRLRVPADTVLTPAVLVGAACKLGRKAHLRENAR